MDGILLDLFFYARVQRVFSWLRAQSFLLTIRRDPRVEAAYSLHNRVFMENLRTILLYAVFGTIINFILIGERLYLY